MGVWEHGVSIHEDYYFVIVKCISDDRYFEIASVEVGFNGLDQLVIVTMSACCLDQAQFCFRFRVILTVHIVAESAHRVIWRIVEIERFAVQYLSFAIKRAGFNVKDKYILS